MDPLRGTLKSDISAGSLIILWSEAKFGDLLLLTNNYRVTSSQPLSPHHHDTLNINLLESVDI